MRGRRAMHPGPIQSPGAVKQELAESALAKKAAWRNRLRPSLHRSPSLQRQGRHAPQPGMRLVVPRSKAAPRLLAPQPLRTAAGSLHGGRHPPPRPPRAAPLTVRSHGTSSARPTSGTRRAYVSTVGMNSQKRSQKPYASTAMPTMVHPTITSAAPPR